MTSSAPSGRADAVPPRVVRELVASVAPARAAPERDVRAHLDRLTKPPGSLGRLEDLAVRLAGIYGDPPPPLRRRLAVVMAADHGVARAGVSAYPVQVTLQMCRNLAGGGAAACALARAVDAELAVVDVGVDGDLADVPGLVGRKVRRGTRDLADEAAMTPDEAASAMAAGAEVVRARLDRATVVALGEMGIGNSTAAAALACALLGEPARRVVGPGTGVHGARLEHKRAVVERALARVRRAHGGDAHPFTLLAELGGLEIAALAGATLAAAAAGRAVVLDGFLASTAGLAAARLCPAAGGHLIASHRSAEPGHDIVLGALRLEPVLDLGLRLGEGTGALLALPLLEAAAAVLRDMATFEGAGVAGPTGDAAP